MNIDDAAIDDVVPTEVRISNKRLKRWLYCKLGFLPPDWRRYLLTDRALWYWL